MHADMQARAALMRTSLTAHELMDRVMARDLDLAEWIFAGAQIAQAAAAEAQQVGLELMCIWQPGIHICHSAATAIVAHEPHLP
jgi:hypothetical protein